MQLTQVLFGQVRAIALTIPRDCIHILLLGGFWDTTEPGRDKEFLLKAEGNTS